MVNIIIQLSKYVIIILMAAYTFSCFSIFTRNYEDEEKRVLIRQDVLMFLLQFAAFGTMYLATKDTVSYTHLDVYKRQMRRNM